MSEWIRVEDRLPPPESGADVYFMWESDMVAVYDRDIGVCNAYLRGFGPLAVDEDEPPQWLMQGRDGLLLDAVTHWQPLPAPPVST